MATLCPNPFAAEGRWFKGNLHMHTTRSDGKKDPWAAVQWYKENGYDFVAITDHRRAPEPEDIASSESFLVIPGEEIDLVDAKTGVPYHIVCLGVDETIRVPEGATANDALALANRHAGLAYVAHPYWHGHEVDDLAGLTGHAGIEIYNTTCEFLNGKGLSVAHWDALLKRGILTWGFAADDTHWAPRPDQGFAWIAVKARELSLTTILEALRTGNFYSSTGPVIEAVEVAEDRIYVRTSPAEYIVVSGPGPRGFVKCAEGGAKVTELEHRLTGKEQYLRVHVVDENGRTAWTNPVVFRPRS